MKVATIARYNKELALSWMLGSEPRAWVYREPVLGDYYSTIAPKNRYKCAAQILTDRWCVHLAAAHIYMKWAVVYVLCIQKSTFFHLSTRFTSMYCQNNPDTFCRVYGGTHGNDNWKYILKMYLVHLVAIKYSQGLTQAVSPLIFFLTKKNFGIQSKISTDLRQIMAYRAGLSDAQHCFATDFCLQSLTQWYSVLFYNRMLPISC